MTNFDVQSGSPRAFAKMVFKQGEEGLGEENEQTVAEDTQLTLNQSGKQIFNQGEEDAEIARQPSGFQPNRPQPNRPQPAAQIAAQVYNKMLVLGNLYSRLARFDTQYREILNDMQDELNILTIAMLGIYQNLSRGRRMPPQNFNTPLVTDFCSGVNVTIAFLRGLLFDIRRLQRAVNNTNIDLQLIIINQTLLAHQQHLFEMRTDCRS